MNKGLIFDIGFHVGQDTEFYLKKGFWVVAVDANPLLIDEGKRKFAEYIDAGRLILLNVGIGQREETLPFYVNKQLSEWSSFDKEIGTSRGDYYVIDVPVVTLRSIAIRYGMPYYIKIDIEGHDMMAIQSLRDMDDKPKYISVENGHACMIEELYSQGYKSFKFINQKNVSDMQLPNPAREGKYIDHKFMMGASGPFGEETIGPWLSKENVLRLSNNYWSNPHRDDNIDGWYDLHACIEEKVNSINYENGGEANTPLTFARCHIDNFINVWKTANGHSNQVTNCDYQKLDELTELVTQALWRFEGNNVLDIGCNSGLHSLALSTVANTVIGCDREELFINRANAAKQYLRLAGQNPCNLHFEKSDFINLLKPDINAILACRILYHIGDSHLAVLMKFLRGNVEKIIIQCRPQRDIVYPSDQIAYTKDYRGLYKVRDCVDLLEDCGFKKIEIWGFEHLPKYNNEQFPVIYGEK